MLTFQHLQCRLLAVLQNRIRNGAITERGLARASGVSQPHLHNVLKGVRLLTPSVADRMLEALEISVIDLLESDEIPRKLRQER